MTAEVFVRPTRYEVTAWPGPADGVNRSHYVLYVEWRGDDLWCVTDGSYCYRRDGHNDRRILQIRYGDGRTVTLHSERPEGFTASEALRAGDEFQRANRLVAGQVNRSRLVRIGGHSVLIKVNTGPPTWWLPRADIGRNSAMFGWFRLLVAASWKRDPAVGGTA
jgi:hypothetical protein